jgi:ABC-type multidrug transport system ATPase subunit
LRRVGLPAGFGDKPVTGLSDGEAQRVSLARALVNEPEVLLLDEPTAALDPTASQVIEDLLAQLAGDTDLTFIFVTHNLAQARRIGDHGLLLVDGGSSTTGRCRPSSTTRRSRRRACSSRAASRTRRPQPTGRPRRQVALTGRRATRHDGEEQRRSGARRGARPMLAAQPFSFTSVAAALLLVGLALLLSWRQHLDVEKEMAWACIRAFVQLMAIGYVIHLILRTDRPI